MNETQFLQNYQSSLYLCTRSSFIAVVIPIESSGTFLFVAAYKAPCYLYSVHFINKHNGTVNCVHCGEETTQMGKSEMWRRRDPKQKKIEPPLAKTAVEIGKTIEAIYFATMKMFPEFNQTVSIPSQFRHSSSPRDSREPVVPDVD